MNTNTFCVLPWIHLATHPQGDVSLCCRVDYNDGIGMAFNVGADGKKHFKNLNRDGLETILNSDSFRKARVQMLAGEKPAACSGCYKDEALGLVSKRMRENKVFNQYGIEQLRAVTDSTGGIETKVEYAELRLGNLCNLKCRTCNPNSSSKWVAEYNSLQTDLNFVRKYDLKADFSWAESQNFWDDFFSRSTNLKQLYINGGEPTLIKQHWQFLQNLISAGRSSGIDIKYNINMTHLPSNAFEIWKQFKSVFVGASVDDIGERNSYIRHGAKWAEVEKNLRLIRDGGFGIAIEQTVSVYNLYYLDEMESYCNSNGIGYGLNFVYDPDYLSPAVLPEDVKKHILQKLRPGLSDRIFSEVSAQLAGPVDSSLWEKFTTYNRYLDSGRKESFNQLFPEYVSFLKGEGLDV